MPVAFLTPNQVARYGCFPADLSLDQLARSAFLDATDRAVLAALRGDHTRLGYAVQLATVRLLGTFLDAPTAVPSVLVTYLAQQIGVAPTHYLERYQRSRMRRSHTLDIRQRYDYRDYRDPPGAAGASYAGCLRAPGWE